MFKFLKCGLGGVEFRTGRVVVCLDKFDVLLIYLYGEKRESE